MPDDDITDVSRREKIDALIRVGKYQPRLTGGIIGLGVFAAVLEGIGLSFILPIIELVQSPDSPAGSGGLAGAFASVYQALNVPLTLGTAVVGVALVMTVRYVSSFLVDWLRAALQTYYIRDLQTRAFDNALNAQVSRQGRHDCPFGSESSRRSRTDAIQLAGPPTA